MSSKNGLLPLIDFTEVESHRFHWFHKLARRAYRFCRFKQIFLQREKRFFCSTENT